MGGLAIFIGFVLSLIFFVPMSTKVLGLLVGSVIIAVMGGVDDIVSLNPWVKLAGQIVAALVAIRCGLVFDVISNPNIFAEETYIEIGWLSIPLTMLWIVGCTNAVNLIDGLDGLAVGVSAISSMTMLIVSLFVSRSRWYPSSSPRSPARASASCRITSTPPRYSWAMSARSFWASCCRRRR